MYAAFYRRVLSWQAKRVPPHWRQHIEVAYDLVTGDHVSYDVIPAMPDMERRRRIREHHQAVVL